MKVEIRLIKDTETKELKQTFFVNGCKIDTECISQDLAEEFAIMELQFAKIVVLNCRTINENEDE